MKLYRKLFILITCLTFVCGFGFSQKVENVKKYNGTKFYGFEIENVNGYDTNIERVRKGNSIYYYEFGDYPEIVTSVYEKKSFTF